MLRREVAPALAKQVGDQQFGALPGGGTVLSSLAVTWCMQRASSETRFAAVLFMDIKAAFYTVLPEVSLGSLLQPHERVAMLAEWEFSDDEIEDFWQVSHRRHPLDAAVLSFGAVAQGRCGLAC